ESDHTVWSRRTESGNLAPRNGKWWEAFRAGAGDRTILTEDECTAALAVQRAVRGNADAMQLLSHGDAEVTLQWRVMGHQAKGRADWITEYEGVPALVGLK